MSDDDRMRGRGGRPPHEFPDDLVERFIREHPEGASDKEIAECFYCSPETVRMIAVSAIRKLRRSDLEDPRLHEPGPGTNLAKVGGVWRAP